MKKNLPIIFDYLKELFPTPETELHYSTPFQFVVAVMLSAQATDVQVNKVTDKLFNHIGISNIPIDKNDVKVSKETSGVVLKKIKNPEDLLTMGFANFERSISSINYYKTKAKHIFQTAKILIERSKIPRPKGHLPLSVKGVRHGIPDTLEELMKLPGVGVKTGKLIAHVLYDKPYIAVDTHIHRVSNRLGIVKSPVQKSSCASHLPSFKKGGQKIKQSHVLSPEKTSELLEKIIPDEYKDHAHHSLVLFGRYYCTAKNPKCEACKLKKICEYYKDR